MKMSSLSTVAMWLVVVGAINWGLWGLMNVNLVASLLGAGSMLERVVYILVGVAGVLMLVDALGMSGGKKK